MPPLIGRRRARMTLGSSAFGAALDVAAQPATAGKARIGAVSAGAGRSAPHWIAFDQRLGELGYAEGGNVRVEFRNAEGEPRRLPMLMAELARSNVDVIFAPGPEASVSAARAATATIPIVVVAIDYDPVVRGHVDGLARPGGNVTGVFVPQIELTGKRVELLKAVIPGVRRVAAFWDSFSADQLKSADAAARSFGFELQKVEFRDPPYASRLPCAPLRSRVRAPCCAWRRRCSFASAPSSARPQSRTGCPRSAGSPKPPRTGC
jgi:putative ABC transport system substrate-binding protein